MNNNNPQQELALIAEMIQTARRQFNEKGTVFLIWGWLVTIAAVSQYILIKMDVAQNSLPWLLMPVGAIAQIFVIRKQKQTDKVKTHIGKVVGRLWLAIGISIALTLGMMYFLQTNTYPVLLILYAIGTFATGQALDVKPLIYGAVCCWIIAAVSFFVDFEIQLLLLAAAMILSYIIPGYAMNARYHKANSIHV